MLRPSLMGALVAAALAWPAAAQDSLCRRRQRRAHRAGGGHQCSADRGLAPLCRSAQRRRRRQRQEDPVDRARRSGRALESRRQCQAAPDPGQCAPAWCCRACPPPTPPSSPRPSGPTCRCMLMGAVCPKEVYPPAEALQFCTTAYAGGYDSRATLAFIKETAKEPVRIGFAAMAIPLSRGEIDYAEEQAKTHGHDRGRQGGHSAADRGLHAVRHQAQGRQPELDIFLGAMGDAGEDLRGAAPAGLAGRLHHLGAYRGRGRTGPPQGPEVLRDRRQLPVPGQSRRSTSRSWTRPRRATCAIRPSS